MVPASLSRPTVALLALLTAMSSATFKLLGPSRLMITPMSPKLILLQESTITCMSRDPEVLAKGIGLHVSCRTRCPAIYYERSISHNTSYLHFRFIPSADWNGTNVTCSIKGLPDYRTPQAEVLVFGAPKLRIIPNVTSYLLFTNVTITCQMEDAEKVDKYFREDLVHSLSCPHGDPPRKSGRFYKDGALSLPITFNATSLFDGCIFTCILFNNRGIKVSEKIHIIGAATVGAATIGAATVGAATVYATTVFVNKITHTSTGTDLVTTGIGAGFYTSRTATAASSESKATNSNGYSAVLAGVGVALVARTAIAFYFLFGGGRRKKSVKDAASALPMTVKQGKSRMPEDKAHDQPSEGREPKRKTMWQKDEDDNKKDSGRTSSESSTGRRSE